MRPQIWCSFCGKSNADVDKLVGRPGVQICDWCIGVAGATIEKYRDRPAERRLPVWGPMSDGEMLDHIPRMAAVALESRIVAALGITRRSAWERFSAAQPERGSTR